MRRDNERNVIYQGNSLSVLKTLPDEFVDCVVTSPPYWGLRDYGTDRQVWEVLIGNPDCDTYGHKWDSEIEAAGSRSSDYKGEDSIESTHLGTHGRDNRQTSCFCGRCGAWNGSLGLEPTFELFVCHLADIFDEVYRVLKPDGTCWVNIGDTYASNAKDSGEGSRGKNGKKDAVMMKQRRQVGDSGLPNKCLCQIPSRFAIEMCERGWILRNEIIWYKPNCMPASVKDRFTVDFEKMFFFTKNKTYHFLQQLEPHKEISLKRAEYGWDCDRANNQTGIHTEKMGDRFVNPLGRNKRCVWEIVTSSFSDAHFATYPEELCETPIKAGSPKGGIVLDPFFGSGTTGSVAKKLGRDYIGIELNPEYIKIAEKRLKDVMI